MKLNLKLVAICLIFIYALSSVSSAMVNVTDFDDVSVEKNNITVDEIDVGNDTSESSDKEIPVVDDDVGNSDDKSDISDTDNTFFDDQNMSDDVLNINNESKTSEDKSTSFEVIGSKPTNMTVSVKDIKILEVPVGQICSNFIEPTPIICELYDENSTLLTRHYYEIMGGVDQIKYPEHLKKGIYTVKIIFNGNDEFNPCVATSTFAVCDNLNLNVNVDDIAEGETAFVKVTTINRDSTPVKLILDDSTYNINVVNGTGNVSIDSLDLGRHYVTANYYGSDYPEERFDTSFCVKTSPALAVNVNSIGEGESALVKVSADNRFSGNVLVQLNSSSTVYDVYVVNGEGSRSVLGLSGGKYYVATNFAGNDLFVADTANAQFVVKMSPALAVNVNSIGEGESALVKVSADNRFSGNVLVQLNSSSTVYDVYVVNGEGSLSIDGLDVGEYSCISSFDGNDLFDADEVLTTFFVNENGGGSGDDSDDGSGDSSGDGSDDGSGGGSGDNEGSGNGDYSEESGLSTSNDSVSKGGISKNQKVDSTGNAESPSQSMGSNRDGGSESGGLKAFGISKIVNTISDHFLEFVCTIFAFLGILTLGCCYRRYKDEDKI